MSARGRDNDTPKQTSKRTIEQKRDEQNRAATEAHRLRGDELADDFADAEGDSCTVIHHRDEKESDS